MAINITPLRNVYPTEGSETLGQYATPEVLGPTPEAVAAGTAGEVEEALRVGGQANPLIGLLVFVALAVVISMLATRFKKPEESYANIRLTAYNALFISLVAIAGIPVWKFLFTKLKLPGVSAWVHSV